VKGDLIIELVHDSGIRRKKKMRNCLSGIETPGLLSEEENGDKVQEDE